MNKKRIKNKYLLVLLFLAATWLMPANSLEGAAQGSAWEEVTEPLSLQTGTRIFLQWLKDNGSPGPVVPDEPLLIRSGPFTGRGRADALVLVRNDMANFSHAQGWSHLYWAAKEGDWRIRQEIAGCDQLNYELKDVDGDGLPEIIVQAAATQMGETFSLETTYKFQNGKYVEMKFVAKNDPEQAGGASSPVAFAKEEIERLKLLWEPLMYTSIFGVFRIGGGLMSLGAGYIFLESPAIAVNLVTGGPYKVLQSMTFDLSLRFVEELVKSPRATCRSLVRETIDRGWKDYQVAYGIVKKYRREKKLSCPDALRFLAARFGADKMTLANNLRQRIASQGYALPAAVADKAVKEVFSALDAKWQKKLGTTTTLPLSETAFFIRDVTAILRQKKLGLMNYEPYLSFMAKMEPINKALIEEAKKYGCTGGAVPAIPDVQADRNEPASIPPGADAVVVGAWGFDEGRGNKAADGSGNRMDLILTGATWVPGISGTAVHIYGAGANATAVNQAMLNDLGTFTIEFWLKGWNGSHIIINKDIVGTTTRDWALGGCQGNHLNFLYNGNEQMCSRAAIDTRQWTYIALVRDMQQNSASIYINGSLDSRVNATINRVSVSEPLTLGQWSANHGAFANMIIDELKISNVAKTAVEIAAIWNNLDRNR